MQEQYTLFEQMPGLTVMPFARFTSEENKHILFSSVWMPFDPVHPVKQHILICVAIIDFDETWRVKSNLNCEKFTDRYGEDAYLQLLNGLIQTYPSGPPETARKFL